MKCDRTDGLGMIIQGCHAFHRSFVGVLEFHRSFVGVLEEERRGWVLEEGRRGWVLEEWRRRRGGDLRKNFPHFHSSVFGTA
jgi:hypothetical protein